MKMWDCFFSREPKQTAFIIHDPPKGEEISIITGKVMPKEEGEMLIESSKVQNVKVLVLPQAALENTFIYLLSNTLMTLCESDIFILFTFLQGRLHHLQTPL